MKNRIESILQEKELKISWLAHEMEKPYITVYRWCKNWNQQTMKNLVAVSKKLGVAVSTLIEK